MAGFHISSAVSMWNIFKYLIGVFFSGCEGIPLFPWPIMKPFVRQAINGMRVSNWWVTIFMSGRLSNTPPQNRELERGSKGS